MQKVIVLMLLAVFLIAVVPSCFAESTDAIEKEVTVEMRTEIWENIRLKLISEPRRLKGFSCFDVSEDGSYVLVASGTHDSVLIYDATNNYQYGFSMDISGSLGVKWDGETIVLYLIVSDIAIWIDEAGNCVDMKWYDGLSELEREAFIRKDIYANVREVNGVVYSAKHWLYNSPNAHWGSYPTLVKTLPNGEEVVLFEGTDSSTKIVIAGVLAIAFVVWPIIFISTYRRKAKKTADGLREPY